MVSNPYSWPDYERPGDMLEMKNADISYSKTLYRACPDFRLTAMLEKNPERLEAYRTRQGNSWIRGPAGNWPELVKGRANAEFIAIGHVIWKAKLY